MKEQAKKRKSADAVVPASDEPAEGSNVRYVPDFSKKRKSCQPKVVKTGSLSKIPTITSSDPHKNVSDIGVSSSEPSETISSLDNQKKPSKHWNVKGCETEDVPENAISTEYSAEVAGKGTENAKKLTKALKKRKPKKSKESTRMSPDCELVENASGCSTKSFGNFTQVTNDTKGTIPSNKDENNVAAESGFQSTSALRKRKNGYPHSGKRRKTVPCSDEIEHGTQCSVATQSLARFKFVSKEERTAAVEATAENEAKSPECMESSVDVKQAIDVIYPDKVQKQHTPSNEDENNVATESGFQSTSALWERKDIYPHSNGKRRKTAPCSDEIERRTQCNATTQSLARFKFVSEERTTETAAVEATVENEAKSPECMESNVNVKQVIDVICSDKGQKQHTPSEVVKSDLVNSDKTEEMFIETDISQHINKYVPLAEFSSNAICQESPYFYKCVSTSEEEAEPVHINFANKEEFEECKDSGLNNTAEVEKDGERNIGKEQITSYLCQKSNDDILPTSEIRLKTGQMITENKVCVRESGEFQNSNENSQGNSHIREQYSDVQERETEGDSKNCEQDVSAIAEITKLEPTIHTSDVISCSTDESILLSRHLRNLVSLNSEGETGDVDFPVVPEKHRNHDWHLSLCSSGTSDETKTRDFKNCTSVDEKCPLSGNDISPLPNGTDESVFENCKKTENTPFSADICEDPEMDPVVSLDIRSYAISDCIEDGDIVFVGSFKNETNFKSQHFPTDAILKSKIVAENEDAPSEPEQPAGVAPGNDTNSILLSNNGDQHVPLVIDGKQEDNYKIQNSLELEKTELVHSFENETSGMLQPQNTSQAYIETCEAASFCFLKDDLEEKNSGASEITCISSFCQGDVDNDCSSSVQSNTISSSLQPSRKAEETCTSDNLMKKVQNSMLQDGEKGRYGSEDLQLLTEFNYISNIREPTDILEIPEEIQTANESENESVGYSTIEPVARNDIHEPFPSSTNITEIPEDQIYGSTVSMLLEETTVEDFREEKTFAQNWNKEFKLPKDTDDGNVTDSRNSVLKMSGNIAGNSIQLPPGTFRDYHDHLTGVGAESGLQTNKSVTDIVRKTRNENLTEMKGDKISNSDEELDALDSKEVSIRVTESIREELRLPTERVINAFLSNSGSLLLLSKNADENPLKNADENALKNEDENPLKNADENPVPAHTFFDYHNHSKSRVQNYSEKGESFSQMPGKIENENFQEMNVDEISNKDEECHISKSVTEELRSPCETEKVINVLSSDSASSPLKDADVTHLKIIDINNYSADVSKEHNDSTLNVQYDSAGSEGWQTFLSGVIYRPHGEKYISAEKEEEDLDSYDDDEEFFNDSVTNDQINIAASVTDNANKQNDKMYDRCNSFNSEPKAEGNRGHNKTLSTADDDKRNVNTFRWDLGEMSPEQQHLEAGCSQNYTFGNKKLETEVTQDARESADFHEELVVNDLSNPDALLNDISDQGLEKDSSGILDFRDTAAKSEATSVYNPSEEEFDDDFELTASQLSQLDADVLKETTSPCDSTASNVNTQTEEANTQTEEETSYRTEVFESSSIALEILNRLRRIDDKVTSLQGEMQMLQHQILNVQKPGNNHQPWSSYGRY